LSIVTVREHFAGGRRWHGVEAAGEGIATGRLKSLAAAWAPAIVRVNAVAPGHFLPAMPQAVLATNNHCGTCGKA